MIDRAAMMDVLVGRDVARRGAPGQPS